MRQKSTILQILKTVFLIPLIIILAIIAAIYAMVKKGEYDIKQGEKIIRRRIEILLKNNPMLVQNINKLSSSIFNMIEKVDKESSKYLVKLPINNKSIELDLDDNSNSDNIKLSIYTFEIDGDKILKDCTGFEDIDDFVESLGYSDNYDIDDVESENKSEDISKIHQKVKNILNTVNLINSCMKEQYRGIIKLYCDFDEEYYLRDVIQNKSYIVMKINGNINHMDLPKEFKEKVKNVAAKIKL